MRKRVVIFIPATVCCMILFAQPLWAQPHADKLSRDIGECISFLEQHPDSSESDAVSDSVCQYLLDGLGPNSTKEEYEHAISFARSPEMKLLAEKRFKEWERDYHVKRFLITTKGILFFGIGTRLSAYKNNDCGLFGVMRIGSDYFPINYSATAGWSFWNPFLPKGADASCQWTSFDIGISWSINTQWKGTFVWISTLLHIPVDEYDSVTPYYYDDIAQGSDSITYGFGQKSGRLEWHLGLTYDMTPAYWQKKVYESEYHDYYLMRDVIDSRWRISMELIYYLKW